MRNRGDILRSVKNVPNLGVLVDSSKLDPLNLGREEIAAAFGGKVGNSRTGQSRLGLVDDEIIRGIANNIDGCAQVLHSATEFVRAANDFAFECSKDVAALTAVGTAVRKGAEWFGNAVGRDEKNLENIGKGIMAKEADWFSKLRGAPGAQKSQQNNKDTKDVASD